MALIIWRLTVKIISKNPVIVLPFFILGLFEALSLVLIYLAPQPPMTAILAPPIRAFWGERYLHYPLNLLLVPRLFNYAQILITAIIGVLMTGLAIGMLNQSKAENSPKILPNFIYAIKRYFAILAIWLIMFIPALLVYRIPRFFIPLNNRAVFQITFYFCFLVVILIQVAFIYAFPAAVVERRGVISAIRRSLLLSKKYFLTTFILVMAPSLFYIPPIILKGNLPALMSRFFPEVVLIIVGLGIVVSVLVDCLITCATTVLFLNQENPDEVLSAVRYDRK